MAQKDVVAVLEDFIEDDLHGMELHGYAARDAARVLLDKWGEALAEGCESNLVVDVERVIESLRDFKQRAMEIMPVKNGGLGGISREDWMNRLNEECDVSVYEAEDLPGHFGFTGCDADCYLSEDEALSAAILANFS